MVACLGHILKGTQGIEIKHGTYIDVKEIKSRAVNKNHKTYRIFYLSYLSLLCS